MQLEADEEEEEEYSFTLNMTCRRKVANGVYWSGG